MSQRKLQIIIDAEDKYCGECENNKWRTIIKNYYPFCKHFGKLESRNGIPLRCQACLDAEQAANKTAEILRKVYKELERYAAGSPLIEEIERLVITEREWPE